jgi:glutamate 5-kinase
VTEIRGTIVINADAGRVLRRRRTTLLAADVLHCAGDFRAGDKVYVVVRGPDGGQGVVATGVVRCAANMLQAICGSIRSDDCAVDHRQSPVVVDEQDLALLWPSEH